MLKVEKSVNYWSILWLNVSTVSTDFSREEGAEDASHTGYHVAFEGYYNICLAHAVLCYAVRNRFLCFQELFKHN